MTNGTFSVRKKEKKKIQRSVLEMDASFNYPIDTASMNEHSTMNQMGKELRYA